jgi:hypothetical protein
VTRVAESAEPVTALALDDDVSSFDGVPAAFGDAFVRAESGLDQAVDPDLPVLALLRESATACGLRIGRLAGLPLRLDWVDTWRAPAETAQRTAAWWWPFGMGEVAAGVGLTADAVAFLADVFLGGDGSSVTADTVSGELEIAILSRHLGVCFQPLEFLEVPVAAADSSSVVGLGAPASTDLPLELVVSDALMVRLALQSPGGHHGDVLLMLPSRPLLGGSGPTHVAPRTVAASTTDAVQGVPVMVHFRLPSITLSALDVAGLEVGDVVRLHSATTVDGHLAGDSGSGARVLSGALGQRAGNLVVQVHAVTLEAS